MLTRRRSWLLFALMVSASAIVYPLTPRVFLADQNTPIDLEKMVPSHLGRWTQQANDHLQIIDPGQQQLINRIYNQTLTRSYIDPEGNRIMLSIAYGKDQRDSLQLHKPEVCYPAQGFSVQSKQIGVLKVAGNEIPVTRLSTHLGQRNEPVTYWTMVGENVFTSGTDKKLAEMRYGFSGKIPDGMLVRISSIDNDTNAAYAIHERFANELVQALPATVRARFSGIR